MIVCPSCGRRNRGDATVCVSCGASLEGSLYRTCHICGSLNPATNAYCHRCYSLLDDSVVGPEAEPEPTAPAKDEIAERGSVDASVGSLATDRVEAESVDEEGLFRQVAESSPTWRRIAEARRVADLDGPLPLEESAVRPQVGAPVPLREPSDAERHAAELFRQTVSERAPLAEPTRLVASSRVPKLGRLGRTMIYLLVLAAALIPFVTGGYTRSWVTPRASVAALYANVEGLSGDTPVLISFDYGATYSAEIDPLAVAVMAQMVDRSVPMLIMSTTPTGLGMADRVMDELIESQGLADLEYGADYALLGFVPGEEAGLRTLVGGLGRAFPTDAREGRPLGDLPIGADLETLEDVSHVFVLADDQITVRQWVEQVQGRTGVFLHALVTSRVEPMLVPYHESGQLTSLLAAATGAAEYEALSGYEGKGLLYSDGIAALALVVLGLALVANVTHERPRSPDEEDDY